MRSITLLSLLCLSILSSCIKGDITVNPVTPSSNAIPDGFHFATSKNIELETRLLTNDDKPLAGILVNVYSAQNPKSPLFTALSDAAGKIQATLHVPAYLDKLIIDPDYIGLMRNATAVINGSSVKAVIGGKAVYGGDVIPAEMPANIISTDGSDLRTNKVGYEYLGAYDDNGRPTNLTLPSDQISNQFWTSLNYALPGGKPVPTYYPEYLAAGTVNNLVVTKTADVWITFVHEGTANLNALGFYTFPTGNPPATFNDITTIKVAIPNTSLSGSGGNMRTGDKIKLGTFPAGTSIGFVLFQNAWNPASKRIQTNAVKFFSGDAYNTMEDPGFRRHMVTLYDASRKVFVHGFEEQERDNGDADNDFNDLVFYSSANPVDGASGNNVVNLPVIPPPDGDGDGVPDATDQFPTDPQKAYIQYFPGENTWGTLSFEDLWPFTGDYDLNDLVVGYRYAFINNASNNTVELTGRFMIRGVGAYVKNGFGIQLPFAPGKISSITGQRFLSSYISRNANGTEAGQSKAVFFPFDDAEALIERGIFANNFNGKPVIGSDTAVVKIIFTAPLTAQERGIAPFNPFVVSNKERGREVHLPGQLPTDKANTQLFGTASDRTNPATNKYYLTGDNWPWALSFVEDFHYPTEYSHISNAYNFFLFWAKSGGTAYTDWYTNKVGFRNAALIYTR